ncbi:MAG: HAD-IIIA family hydrolase [Chitinophagia bacterium]|jgi:D-glycero-alpha-D-manno-heptose 1-phosphate guanylyltransferase
MIKEAIILAGGLGTRLRDTVPDLPKCMAPVAGKPFLFYVINHLRSQGIEKFIFSLGYKHEFVEEYLLTEFSTLSYTCVIEQEPLGTGGAILLASESASEEHVIVTNGDTLFAVELTTASDFHFKANAVCTLMLKPMQEIDRYGIVDTDENNCIVGFQEKKYYPSATINGGVYILDINKFKNASGDLKFSFEKDYLEKNFGQGSFYGLEQNTYFIDIGIPEDYTRAQKELQKPRWDLRNIDHTWSVFIDRDGVINEQKEGGYILNWEEFRFLPDVKNALEILSNKFDRIVVISNQRGVGKGLMSEASLNDIHQKMKDEVVLANGRIDEIFYCTSIENCHPDRKPNPGMAYRAKKSFPEINFSKTIMIGNKLSDMYFAQHAGVYAIFLSTTNPEVAFPHPIIDDRYASLFDFAKQL